jgi:hypothetical protein
MSSSLLQPQDRFGNDDLLRKIEAGERARTSEDASES